VGYQTILLDLIRGIADASLRISIARAFTSIMEGYRYGVLDDRKLRAVLTEFCLDVLSVKYPTRDVEELRPEAERCSEELYYAVRVATLVDRYTRASGTGVG